MTEPHPTVYTYVRYVDLDNGVEHILSRTTLGSDHEDAARQAFASLSGTRVNIRQIETFDGEPRRWVPEFSVREQSFPREAVSPTREPEA